MNADEWTHQILVNMCDLIESNRHVSSHVSIVSWGPLKTAHSYVLRNIIPPSAGMQIFLTIMPEWEHSSYQYLALF